MKYVFLCYVLERDNRQDVSDGEDVVGERLQQDVVSCFRFSQVYSNINSSTYAMYYHVV